jgi:hypothetical protein
MAKKAKDRRSAASSARSQAAGLSFLTKKFRCYSNTPPSSESWSPSRISAPATEPAEAELPGVLAWMAAAVGLLLAGWRAQTGWWVLLPSLGAALELCGYDGGGDGAHMATTAAATAPATHTHARTHAHTHTHSHTVTQSHSHTVTQSVVSPASRHHTTTTMCSGGHDWNVTHAADALG